MCFEQTVTVVVGLGSVGVINSWEMYYLFFFFCAKTKWWKITMIVIKTMIWFCFWNPLCEEKKPPGECFRSCHWKLDNLVFLFVFFFTTLSIFTLTFNFRSIETSCLFKAPCQGDTLWCTQWTEEGAENLSAWIFCVIACFEGPSSWRCPSSYLLIETTKRIFKEIPFWSVWIYTWCSQIKCKTKTDLVILF